MRETKSKKGTAKVSQTAVEKYTQFLEKAAKCVVGRQREVTGIGFALLMKEHVLLKGNPGEAKSMLAKILLEGITGAKVFKFQFSNSTSEDMVFGPPIFEEIKQGRVIRNTKNSLVDCQFGFLDEAFNASKELLLSMNEVLNERTFTRNAQEEKCPLVSAILTTNQNYEKEEKLRAVYDRIFFTFEVNPLDLADSVKVMAGDYSEAFPKIAMKVVEEVVNGFKPESIFISTELLKDLLPRLIEIAGNLNQPQYSTRRLRKIVTFLKASAYLNGRAAVKAEDLDALTLLASDQSDMGSVSSVLADIKRKPYFIDDTKLRNMFDTIHGNNTLDSQEKTKLYRKLRKDASAAKLKPLLKEIDARLDAITKDEVEEDFTLGGN